MDLTAVCGLTVGLYPANRNCPIRAFVAALPLVSCAENRLRPSSVSL